ncbi:hypothetical protein ACFU96_40875 [Streptomyces sp. NPDC057620]
MSRQANLPAHPDQQQVTPDAGKLTVAWADGMDADTVNRELSIARKTNG